MSGLRDLATWLSTDGSTLWLTTIVGLFMVFGAIETLWPGLGHVPDRGRRWPTNFGLTGINICLVSALPVSGVLAASWADTRGIGILNQVAGPQWIAVASTLLLRSLVSYLVHMLMHKVPLLWRLHRVHHLDTHLDISTTVRHHPGEALINVFVMIVVAITFGLSPWVLALYEIAEFALAVISHANVQFPQRVDTFMRWFVVTPNMHKVHHSSFQPETDSNYGTVLTIWDRLFGTYTKAPSGGYESIQIGLEEVRDKRASDLIWQIKSPKLHHLTARE